MQPVRKLERNKNRSRFPKIIIILLLLICAIGAGSFLLGKRYYENALSRPLSDSSEEITFEILVGESTDAIIKDLSDKKIISPREGQYMKLYLSLNNLGSTLQAGSFRIPQNLTIKELVMTLQNASIPEVWVTLTEGLRVDEFAQILATKFTEEGGSFDKNEFLRLVEDPEFIAGLNLQADVVTLEGFLFPDKYLLPLQLTEREIIETMVDNFKEKVGDNYDYDTIIIASMLEREGKTAEEKRMISDIILRRLEEGWFLGIDATLLYQYKDWKYPLTSIELETDHPYNSRTRLGLPPTPIANPGLVSIDATRNPKANDYYYYLHGTDGIIRYAKTFEEHSSNIAKYLQ